MTKKLLIDPAALSEAGRGARWYDRKRRGLGDELLAEVDAVLEALPRGTLHALRVEGPWSLPASVWRVRVARFPYSVIYVETDERIQVVAVAHVRKAPDYWHRRLQRLGLINPEKNR